MIDFSSALYLGWNHAGVQSRRGQSVPLTLGKPAAQEEAPGSRKLASLLAGLAGAEAGLLMPSTLHAALDVCLLLAKQGVDFLAETGSYYTSRRPPC
jgi:8-amino-7-oxononanoate synthase